MREFSSSRRTYRPLADQDAPGESVRSRAAFSVRAVVQFLVCASIFGAIGFFTGRVSGSRGSIQDSRSMVNFTYHELYSEPPSPESNGEWLALFPKAHGFVRPPGTSGLSLISVFHQLHCINVLRHGYYVAFNSSYEEQSLQDITISRESIKHEHVIHCFDYLRQAVTCFSDRTVEKVNVSRGGATGWGSVHQCRDHDQTMELATKWELHKSDLSQGAMMHR